MWLTDDDIPNDDMRVLQVLDTIGSLKTVVLPMFVALQPDRACAPIR